MVATLFFALQLYSPLPHAVLNRIHRWIHDPICWISNVLMRVNMTVIQCLCAEGRTTCLCAWIRRPTQEVCVILDFIPTVYSLFDHKRHFRFVLFTRSCLALTLAELGLGITCRCLFMLCTCQAATKISSDRSPAAVLPRRIE